jgi:hypothetical protein
MSKKMQQLLDLIVNEETEKANELFHEIVVERSREIYENLIAEEEQQEMEEDSEDDNANEMDESSNDEDDDLEEMFGHDADMDDNHGDETDAIGGDPADSMVGDTEVGHDDGEESGDAPATKDDVQDLEDALAELKAEFEALMGGEGDDDMDMDEPEDDDGEENPFDDQDDDAEDDDNYDDQDDDDNDDDYDQEDADESMGLREYRETVNHNYGGNTQKQQGVNIGGHTSDDYPAPRDVGSNINKNAKNTMPNSKANASNIAQGDVGEGAMDGTSTNMHKGKTGLVGNIKGEFTKGVEKNLANSAKAKMKDGASLEAVKKGHGAERKGTTPGPVGSGTGEKAGQTSVTNSKQFLQPYKK